MGSQWAEMPAPFSLRKLFNPRFAGPVAALGLVVLAAGARHLAARVFEPVSGARWIWAAGDYREGDPISFYAVRELDLEATVPARIAIAADETYLLYVNGRRAGAGSYRRNAPLDEYEVGALLEPGLNRILVEVRSSRGAGGLIAEIGLGDAHRNIVTDASWRIYKRYDPGLFGGWSSPEAGEAPVAWGRPPTGRWRLAAARLRPVPPQGLLPPALRRPLRHRPYHDAAWLELDETRRQIPALGPQQIFDWGEEVEGIVSFDLRSDQGKPGLLYASAEPPDAQERPPDAIIIPVPGRRYWEDAQPRRFRYLLLVGVEPASRIEVELPNGTSTRALEVPSEEPRDGIFGIEPPRSYSRVEEAVWERLEKEAAAQVGL